MYYAVPVGGTQDLGKTLWSLLVDDVPVLITFIWFLNMNTLAAFFFFFTLGVYFYF